MAVSITSNRLESLPVEQMTRNNMSVEAIPLANNYQRTLATVADYARKYQDRSAPIKLVAVSKRHTAEKVVELIKLGQRDFAENYVQEGVEKIARVKIALENLARENNDLKNNICWHFIGHIQSRKCTKIAECFDWVHTVHSTKVAEKLNQHRENRMPLQVLIQLNLQQESSKSGVCLNELPKLAEAIRGMSNLTFRGLMMIPEIESDFAKQRAIFRRCRMALEQLNRQGFALDQLSMGMSGDMQAAILEGATQIRIGTALFGPRPT